ncbi:hypothetical protein ACFL54_01630 [Planctomycetota bacterium]
MLKRFMPAILILLCVCRVPSALGNNSEIDKLRKSLLAWAEDSSTKKTCLDLIRTYGSEAGDMLEAAFRDEPNQWIRGQVMAACKELDIQEMTEFYLTALADDFVNVRLAAFELLNKFKQADLTPRLEKLLDHKNPWTRNYALQILCAWEVKKEKEINGILMTGLRDSFANIRMFCSDKIIEMDLDQNKKQLEKFREDNNAVIRHIGLVTLAGLDIGLEYCRFVVQALQDNSNLVAAAARKLLEKYPEPETRKYLLELLEAGGDVNYHAVLLLARMGERAVIGRMVPLLNHKITSIAKEIKELLLALDARDRLGDLQKGITEFGDWGRFYCYQICKEWIGDKDLPALLVSGLADKFANVKLFCRDALIAGDIQDALPELYKQLEHQDKWTRATALEVIIAVGKEEAIPHFLPCILDKFVNVRVIAQKAFNNFEDRYAVPQLFQALAHEKYNIREFALRQIIKATGTFSRLEDKINMPLPQPEIDQLIEKFKAKFPD